ncbi:hypothetical protein ACET3Z_016265 [Daucus carota]
MEENDMAKHVDDRPRFRKIVDLAGFYKFESSEAPKQVKAISKGRVSAKLQNFLLDNLPELEAEKKPEFKLGVKDIKLGARIFRKTNIPCICDKYVLELIRGVHKHFDLLTRFPEVSVHYTVTRSKDSKLLLDTNTLGDPVQFRVGRGEVIRALDLGICGMFVRGERRLKVPVSLGYETKSGRGTKDIKGPKGASGHKLIIDVTLVAVDF